MKAPRQEDTATGRILEHLAYHIASGTIKEGDRLPSRSVLAEQFGVARCTVSLALRRLATRYPLDFQAGKGVFLSGKKENKRPFTIGMIGPYASEIACEKSMARSRGYWSAIVNSIMLSCEKHRHALLFVPDTAREPLDIDRIESLGVDCLISHGILLARETALELRRRGQPLLLGNRGDGSLPSLGFSYVDYGVVDMFRQTARMLCQEGHKRIAYVMVQPSDKAWKTWRDAFRWEAAECGIGVPPEAYCRMVPRDIWTQEEGVREAFRKETAALLDLPEPPTGILFHLETYMVDGALAVIRSRGLELEKDISVVALALPGNEKDAEFGVFVEDAKALGEELVTTAVKLSRDPHEVFHIDVPMRFVRSEAAGAGGLA